MTMLRDTQAILAYCLVYALVFGLGELLVRRVPSRPEVARKAVHFTSGLTALTFPRFLESHWSLLSLAAGSLLFLAVGGTRLRSIHRVDRESYGVFLFPVTVYVLFLLSRDRYVLYFISILIMTVSDTFAALIGTRYGSILFDVEGTKKSLEGSTAFFFVAFLCVHIPLLLWTGTGRIDSVLISFVIGLVATGFEAISPNGTDNFYVPLGTYYILSRMTESPPVISLEQMGVLFFMLTITIVPAFRARLLSVSGLVGMVLMNCAIWALGDLNWLMPILAAQVILYLLVMYFGPRISDDISGYQIKALFYSAALPVALLFAANTFGRGDLLYLPYLTSVISEVLIVFHFFVTDVKGVDGPSRLLKKHPIAAGTCCSIVLTLAVAWAPVAISYDGSTVAALCIVGASSWTAMAFFSLLHGPFSLREHRLRRQRVRLYSATLAAGAAFAVQLAAALLPGRP